MKRLGATLALVLRFALRDLRGGLGGYWIFLGCIALGVAAIVGVGSVAGGLRDGLAREGRTILGGDAAFSVMAATPPEAETRFLQGVGRSSTVATLRAMARTAAGDTALVDVKAVDAGYPLAGRITLEPPGPLDPALATTDGEPGIVVDEALLLRLDLHIGDPVLIGTGRFRIRATIGSEPDKLAGGIAFGPRVLMSRQGLEATGLAQPGALIRWSTRVIFPTANGVPIPDEALDAMVADAKGRFPDSGLDVRTRRSVSPEFDRNLARFTQFLTLVGLTALIVGGVGVANAVRATVERKRIGFAVLKAVGATGGTVFLISLAQVMLVALIGVAAGVLVGAALPYVAVLGFGTLIPFPLVATIVPGAVASGVLYGLLTALGFSLTALGRAHDIPVSALFRDAVDPDRRGLRLRYRVAAAVAVLALAGVTVLFAADRRIALIYVGATVAAVVLLRLVAAAIMLAARRMPHARQVPLRLAVANIHRPGALTPAVVLSLGLGLALLVTLTLIDVNIRNQINHTTAGKTPSFFFVDIPSRTAEEFARFVTTTAPGATVNRVPMMRGRIVALRGEPVDKARSTPDAAWVLEGDRGITFADTLPEGSTLVAGSWWASGYAGPPLVSFDNKLAAGLGLKLGDTVTVNVLGRTITATIANLRQVDWESLGINFVMVFSPNTFRGAPHMELATSTFPDNHDPAREVALLRAVAAQYPTVTAVRVKDALDAVNTLVGRLALAIRGASGVAIAASILVLAGAVAAGRQTRIYEAVVLKVLGATRRRLLFAYLIEYGLLGLVTAVFGILAGSGAAWFVVGEVMHFTFRFAWLPALEAGSVALLATVLLGLAGTWRVLGQKPAAILRGR